MQTSTLIGIIDLTARSMPSSDTQHYTPWLSNLPQPISRGTAAKDLCEWIWILTCARQKWQHAKCIDDMKQVHLRLVAFEDNTLELFLIHKKMPFTLPKWYIVSFAVDHFARLPKPINCHSIPERIMYCSLCWYHFQWHNIVYIQKVPLLHVLHYLVCLILFFRFAFKFFKIHHCMPGNLRSWFPKTQIFNPYHKAHVYNALPSISGGLQRSMFADICCRSEGLW